METPPQFIEPTDTIRVAARETVLQELEAIGSRRKQLLSDADDELERLAAFLPVANAAGIRQNEIAERAAVSRQTLVNLRNEGRGAGTGGVSICRSCSSSPSEDHKQPRLSRHAYRR